MKVGKRKQPKFSNDRSLSFVSTTVQFLFSQIKSCLEKSKFLKAYVCYYLLKIQWNFRALFLQTHPPTPHPNSHPQKKKKKVVSGICIHHLNSTELYKIMYN